MTEKNFVEQVVDKGRSWCEDTVKYIWNHPITSAVVIYPAVLVYVVVVATIKK